MYDFDPIKEGASLISNNKFDPVREGAILIQKKQPEKSYLEKAGQFAEENINKPVRNYVQGVADFTSGAAQGLANIGPGLYNLGAKGLNLIPGLNIKEKKGFDFAPNNINAGIGELASFFGPGLIGKSGLATQTAAHIQKIPEIANAIKKASDILEKSSSENKLFKMLTGKTAKSITSNALLGSLMNPEDQGLGASLGAFGAGAGKLAGSDNKLLSLLARGSAGGAIGYGFGGKKGAEAGVTAGTLSPKLLKILGIDRSIPGQESLKGLRYEDVYPSIEASQRLGTPLRPSEASSNPFTGKIEGNYARTSEASSRNVKLSMERKNKEKTAINSLLNDIYDKSISSDQKINKLYEKSYQLDLDKDLVDSFKNDPVISEAFDNVKNNTRWQSKLKGIPENNYAYLDKVKKSISDEEKSLIKSGKKEEASVLTNVRNNMERVLDENNPTYKQAREEAQKKIIRRKMEEKLKTGEINGKEFYKKFIKNENKFNELHDSLKNVPDAQQKLKDMKNAWHSLINLEKPSSSSFRSESALDQARGWINEIYENLHELVGSQRNVKAIEYIRSDDWIKDLKNINLEKNSYQKEKKLSDLFGKLFPGTLSVSNKEDDNDKNL
ncbi:MAG TPA: hypothetical protein VNF93_02295 [Buchnera sp. (in: enterobacteria)]|nr:hypothetical protein [Buchnera sp. (in: enterobacteria)]